MAAEQLMSADRMYLIVFSLKVIEDSYIVGVQDIKEKRKYCRDLELEHFRINRPHLGTD